MKFAEDFICWIYRHETLTSAFLALFAAGITIWVLVRQIRQSDRQHKLERHKKLEAARAVMPLALGPLVDYAYSALDYSLIVKNNISSDKIHDHKLPQIPDNVVSVLREVIEYADDDRAGHALRKLISEIQYHHARMCGLPRQKTTKSPTGCVYTEMPSSYNQGIWDAVHLYLHASAFFNYARFVTDTLPEEPTSDEVLKRMEFLGICISIKSDDFYVNLVEGSQASWALIEPSTDSGVCVYFIDDNNGVCDQLPFPSTDDAIAALRKKGFQHLAYDEKLRQSLPPPKPPYYQQHRPNSPICSSGRP